MTDMQDELAQVIANSFFGMEAGYLPTESWELPSPSSGDFQLAFDIVSSSVIRRIQAEAWNRALRTVFNVSIEQGDNWTPGDFSNPYL